jgi:hypothetical protein
MPEKFFKVKASFLKKAVLVFTLCISTFFVFGQDEEPEKEKGFQKEKLFVGGNFGVSFGSYTFINISPQIGYRFTDHFAAGVGLNLQYVSDKLEDYNGDTYYKTEQGVTGLSVFGRVYPIRQFMLQVQPEVNYVFGKEKYFQTSYQPAQEYNLNAEIVPSLLLGGGLVLPSGSRGAFIISVFYDILQDPGSPYGKRAIVNFTFNIGL